MVGGGGGAGGLVWGVIGCREQGGGGVVFDGETRCHFLVKVMDMEVSFEEKCNKMKGWGLGELGRLTQYHWYSGFPNFGELTVYLVHPSHWKVRLIKNKK